MLRLIGSILLMGGASAIGFSAAAQLKARSECLRALTGALEYMERELSFRFTATPVLFQELAKVSRRPVRRFFSLCSDKMEEIGQRPLSALWKEALDECKLPLQEGEQGVLLELGQVIGRYDADGQREALSLAREKLDGFLESAVQEQNRLERVYRALGISAGAFLLLVLL